MVVRRLRAAWMYAILQKRRIPMLCFEVVINGEIICVAGVGEKGTLDLGLNWGPWRQEETKTIAQETRLYIAGRNGDNHVAWAGPTNSAPVILKTGDEITVRIVDRESADEPVIVDIKSKRKKSFLSRLKK